MLPSLRGRNVYRGFNPCFVGEGIQTHSNSCGAPDGFRRFNPCFVGEGIQTRWIEKKSRRGGSVSILVLLEKGFRRQSRARTSQFSFGFNPCFVGEGIQTNPQFSFLDQC